MAYDWLEPGVLAYNAKVGSGWSRLGGI